MVIIDSSVWIDLFNRRLTPQTRWLQEPNELGRIGLTSLVLAEVLQGVRLESRFRLIEEYLRAFPIFDMPSTGLAVKSARNYRSLRESGVTVRSTIDCLIATFCLENDHQLLHNDSDFNHFERHFGLQVFHP